MNKTVVAGLLISDDGQWIGNNKPLDVSRDDRGVEFVWFMRKRYFTHIWVARKYLKNPHNHSYVSVIEPDLPITVSNVEFYKSPKRVIDKTTSDQIKKELDAGITGRTIAEHHGISISTVSRIKNGTRWN